MNTKVLRVLVGVLATLALSVSAAKASTIRIVDTFVPGSTVTLSGNGASYTYQFDLTLPTPGTNTLQTYVDGSLVAGEDYDPSTDVFASGTLSLTFANFSTRPSGSNGQFDLVLSYGNVLTQTNFQASFVGLGFDVSAISSAGLLTVTILRTNAAGSVDFTGSVLDVTGTRGTGQTPTAPAPVPEPATLLLFGTGLAAVAAWQRRRN